MQSKAKLLDHHLSYSLIGKHLDQIFDKRKNHLHPRKSHDPKPSSQQPFKPLFNKLHLECFKNLTEDEAIASENNQNSLKLNSSMKSLQEKKEIEMQKIMTENLLVPQDYKKKEKFKQILPHGKFNSKQKERSGDEFPSVGTYKPKFMTLDKHVHSHDFSKTVPHFHQHNFHSQEITPVLKDYPDGLKQTIKGLINFQRVARRTDVKSYNLRMQYEDPHEERFILKESKSERANLVNYDRMLERKPCFPKCEFTPTYVYDDAILAKKYQLPNFKKQTQRNDQFFITKKGISSAFSSDNSTCIAHSKKANIILNKSLDRSKENIVPSHMDVTICSRISLETVNYSTLIMNNSIIKKDKTLKKENPKKILNLIYQDER